jgi:hypothetical protein
MRISIGLFGFVVGCIGGLLFNGFLLGRIEMKIGVAFIVGSIILLWFIAHFTAFYAHLFPGDAQYTQGTIGKRRAYIEVFSGWFFGIGLAFLGYGFGEKGYPIPSIIFIPILVIIIGLLEITSWKRQHLILISFRTWGASYESFEKGIRFIRRFMFVTSILFATIAITTFLLL